MSFKVDVSALSCVTSDLSPSVEFFDAKAAAALAEASLALVVAIPA